MGHSKCRLKREVYKHECQHQKIRAISNKQLDDASQTLRKTRTSQSQSSRWEKIVKIRAKIKDMETKRMIQGISETES
jgi:hypothetical protein